MKPYDCHCHLYGKAFPDIDKIISDAKKVLSGVINSGENPETNREILKLARAYPDFIYPALAIHPTELWKFSDGQVEGEIDFIRKQKPVAIAETGLDLMWIKKVLPEKIGRKKADEEFDRQKKFFKKFMELADELDVPVVCHSRWAVKEVVQMLLEAKPKKAVLHGFHGTIEESRKLLDLGYKISIGTNIVYNDDPKKYLKNFPLDFFVLETDSPVMSPEKGKRNVPMNILLVVKEIARAGNISEEEIVRATNKNIKELFGL